MGSAHVCLSHVWRKLIPRAVGRLNMVGGCGGGERGCRPGLFFWGGGCYFLVPGLGGRKGGDQSSMGWRGSTCCVGYVVHHVMMIFNFILPKGTADTYIGRLLANQNTAPSCHGGGASNASFGGLGNLKNACLDTCTCLLYLPSGGRGRSPSPQISTAHRPASK